MLAAFGIRSFLRSNLEAPRQRRVVRDLDTEPEKRGDRVQSKPSSLSVGDVLYTIRTTRPVSIAMSDIDPLTRPGLPVLSKPVQFSDCLLVKPDCQNRPRGAALPLYSEPVAMTWYLLAACADACTAQARCSIRSCSNIPRPPQEADFRLLSQSGAINAADHGDGGTRNQPADVLRIADEREYQVVAFAKRLADKQ